MANVKSGGRHASRQWMLPLTVVLTILAGVAAPARAQAPPAAADLAARIQSRYETIRDFTADFQLEQTSAFTKKPVTDRGTVAVKKPDKMRWVITTGDRTEFVSDGVQTYSYFPKDKYYARAPLPKGDQAPTPFLFISGRGNIARDFTASLPATHPPGEWHLILKPKAPGAEFSSLVLQVDRAALALRGLEATDANGGVQRFRFSNLRENRGVPDSTFVFRPPAGVELR